MGYRWNFKDDGAMDEYASWRHSTYSMRVHSKYKDPEDAVLLALHETESSPGVQIESEELHDMVYPDLNNQKVLLHPVYSYDAGCYNPTPMETFTCASATYEEKKMVSSSECFEVTE